MGLLYLDLGILGLEACLPVPPARVYVDPSPRLSPERMTATWPVGGNAKQGQSGRFIDIFVGSLPLLCIWDAKTNGDSCRFPIRSHKYGDDLNYRHAGHRTQPVPWLTTCHLDPLDFRFLNHIVITTESLVELEIMNSQWERTIERRFEIIACESALNSRKIYIFIPREMSSWEAVYSNQLYCLWLRLAIIN